MGKRKIIDGTEVHEGSGNVYRDLGYPVADYVCRRTERPAEEVSNPHRQNT